MVKWPYRDPRPELPLSPLMQRGLSAREIVCRAVADITKPDVTKIRKAVTKIQSATKKRGRPKKSSSLPAADRMRKMRAAKKLGVTGA